MTSTIPQTTKKLTRVKLVNWHFFRNETINIGGSCLLSGNTGSGKSTIMDAIQLVLTANTRKFNPAANEKSKRDLKGYVRCKTGDEGSVYARKNGVISYVALEFYEESKDRFFVLGAKFDSPDEESDVKKTWFCEEGSLDAFTFVIDDKPATDDQFKNNGKKIVPIRSAKDAKVRFKRRLGNLDETFFDMIPKSLAFKPMDNVRDFITQFILPKREIEVEALKENIHNLREMQMLIAEIKKQIGDLEEIIKKNDEVAQTKEEMLVIDILLKIAEIEDKKSQIEEYQKETELKVRALQQKTDEIQKTDEALKSERDSLQAIQVAIGNNECSKLIEKLEHDLHLLERNKTTEADHVKILLAQLNNVENALKYIPNRPDEINALAVRAIGQSAMTPEARAEFLVTLEALCKETKDALNVQKAELNQLLNTLKGELADIQKQMESLRKNEIIYPDNTVRLKEAIVKEFAGRSISSDVYVLADLLDVTNLKWQNAVEGYLNTQRFNIIVEPEYYDVAADVYDRLKRQIEGVTLINTQALDLNADVLENSLASVVSTENCYARAYVNYLMGRVMLCDTVSELKQYPTAITAECMLYKNNGLKKIPQKVYQTPYIGKSALKHQLEVAEANFIRIREERENGNNSLIEINKAIEYIEKCNFGFLSQYCSAPVDLDEINASIRRVQVELNDARNDPDVIELSGKEQVCRKKVTSLQATLDELKKVANNIERDISELNTKTNIAQNQVNEIDAHIKSISNDNLEAADSAWQKYYEYIKTSAENIYEKCERRKGKLAGKYRTLRDKLIELQSKYKGGEYGTGEEVMSAYFEEYRNLSVHDLIRYEEDLRKAKENCELEFRETFLAKMRENIEHAQDIFKELNRAMKNVYYGDDSYRFHYSAHHMKRGLYDMITSDINLGGFTLFTNEFEEKYRNEMEELFAKLAESDESGDKILAEYTDYREYLDYDIAIVSRDGRSQYFSKIYGEKSGGETQNPYYVAIAASFLQLYSVGETIKIIMLDEAFDKMDDDRIASTMQFFADQGFQVILAAPPGKIETIGEHVDTILVTYREGWSSTIEEYVL